MVVVVGEILFDLFHDERRIGGAPFNFAYHLKQMGVPVRFVTRIGDDAMGQSILAKLKAYLFDLEDIQIDRHLPTGSVKVNLDERGVPQFDIRRQVAYDYIEFESVRSLNRHDITMIYFGTLAQRTPQAFQRFQQFLAGRGKQTQCFCDINLRRPYVSNPVIHAALKQADILKLNGEELAYLQTTLENGPKDNDAVPVFMDWLMKTYRFECLALTCGEEGSMIMTRKQIVEAPLGTAEVIVDTVGAGDAYAAVLAVGCLNQWSPARTAALAAKFAASVCTYAGALPDDQRIYDNLRAQIQG